MALASRPRGPRRPPRRDPLSRVDPPAYFRALCSLEVPAGGGMVRCPLPDHHEELPSCRVWPTAERGWWCFGCARGGTIYDLASLMVGGPWGSGLRGDTFRRASRLAAVGVGR